MRRRWRADLIGLPRSRLCTRRDGRRLHLQLPARVVELKGSLLALIPGPRTKNHRFGAAPGRRSIHRAARRASRRRTRRGREGSVAEPRITTGAPRLSTPYRSAPLPSPASAGHDAVDEQRRAKRAPFWLYPPVPEQKGPFWRSMRPAGAPHQQPPDTMRPRRRTARGALGGEMRAWERLWLSRRGPTPARRAVRRA